MEIKLTAVEIAKPEPINFILGQTHFIKSVEDIHEALVNTVPWLFANRPANAWCAAPAPTRQ
jgi:adenosine/AMP kinase